MIVQKVFGITQISEGTAFEYRIVQFLLYLGIVGYTILWFVCMFLWPVYYFYKLYRFLKHDEKMGGDDEGYYPWGVRYGCIWNTLIFIGLYVIMPFKIVEASNKEQAERVRTYKPKTEQMYVKPYNPYEIKTIGNTNGTAYKPTETPQLSSRRSKDSELDYFEDHYDGYYDDPEDELTYPPEIFDFNRD